MVTLATSLRYNLFRKELPLSVGMHQTIAVAALCLCTALGAYVSVRLPGFPVPFTLQTFFVLAGSGLLGKRLSVTGQSIYVLLGGIGLPWFAGSAIGAPILFGPTGGYLLGFILASALIGGRSPIGWMPLGINLILGELIILACGTLGLAFSLHLTINQALAWGALPFIPGDALKLLAAAACIRSCQPRAQKLLTA